MMRMRDCHRERIGCIGTGNLYAGEQPRDHRVDLCLLRAAGADHGLLDQCRRIFPDIDARARGAHQHDTASLAELQRRLGVLVDEYLFDGGGGWVVIGDQRFELVR
jgi:hypothetical protein